MAIVERHVRATALGLCAVGLSFGCGGEGATEPSDPSSEDPGTIEARVVPVGTDLDLDGWVLVLRRGGFERRIRLPPSGSLTAQQTANPGAWEVTLTDVAGNCTLTEGTLARTVTVSSGETVPVAFNLHCEAIPPLVDQVVIAVTTWSSTVMVANGLFAVDPATGETRRLTAPPDGTWDNQPHISADGKRVVYVRHDQNADPSSSIRIVNADGTDEPGILSRGENPRWSPDGTRIAFFMGVDGLPDIHVIHPDSSGLENLTQAPDAPDIHPDWSPDGTRIAFRSVRRPGTAGDLYLIDPSGSGLTRLTEPASGGDFVPRWSPEGDRIAFSSNRTGDYRLYLVDPDGANRIMLGAIAGDYDEFGQAWSPDGRRLVFKRSPRQGLQGRTRENDPDLFIFRLDNGEVVRFTDNEVDDHAADWGR